MYCPLGALAEEWCHRNIMYDNNLFPVYRKKRKKKELVKTHKIP